MRKKHVLGAAISLALGTTGAQAIVFNFSNSTSTAVQGSEFSYTECTGTAMNAGQEFRWCDTTGRTLGRGLSQQEDTINGTEQWMFSGNTAGFMTGVANTGITGGLGTAVAYHIDLGYIEPSSDRNGGAALDQGGDLLGASFGFLAPYLGSEAGTYGAPHANDVGLKAVLFSLANVNGGNFKVYFPVLEMQWNGAHLSLGRDGGTGVDAGRTGITFTGRYDYYDRSFSMWAEHTILASEDNVYAGLDGLTAQWYYTGTLLLSPSVTLPIPAAVWLFGSGLLSLVAVARRKKAPD